ncbi:seven in absentia protein [Ostertagia ostertagi]
MVNKSMNRENPSVASNTAWVPSAAVSSSGSSSATALCGPNSITTTSTTTTDRSGSRSGSPPSQFMGPTAPNHGVAAPHQKNLARVQATAPPVPVVTCSPSSLSTQSVAPQIATIGATEHTDSSAEVLSVFECPVCLEYMLPPYLQCQAGHLVCGNCRPKLQCCPTCRGPTPSVRNLGLEKIANTVRFPCKFASSGCPLFFYHFDKVEHEETCECRPYSCPCPGAACKWQGALNDVMDHLKKVHKSITTLQGEDIVFLATDINLPGAVDWVMMQSCFGYNFMLVLEKQEKFDHGQQVFYAVVQLIGAKKEADNFMYRLELSTHRRRLCWEATPRSIHEGVAHAIQLSDCLAFDTPTAQLFAENGNLGINVTISMV